MIVSLIPSFLASFFVSDRPLTWKFPYLSMFTRSQAHNLGFPGSPASWGQGGEQPTNVGQMNPSATMQDTSSTRRRRRTPGDQSTTTTTTTTTESGNPGQLQLTDSTHSENPGNPEESGNKTASTDTTQEQPIGSDLQQPVATGDDDEEEGVQFMSAPGDEGDEEEEAYHIPSKEEVAELIGIPIESGPVGLAAEIGKLTVEQAVEKYALPREYIEQLRKTVQSKLASIPWPRRMPFDLGRGRGRVDRNIVRQEEDLRLVMALVMAGQQEVALAVGLNSLVLTEKLRADQVRWVTHSEVPNCQPEALHMFSTEEETAITRRITALQTAPRRDRFFRGPTKAQPKQQLQVPAQQQKQRGRSRSRPPKWEGQEKSTPNGQGPCHH